MLIIYLKSKSKKNLTQIFSVRSFEKKLNSYVLHHAVSLATGRHYDILEFSRDDWRTI